MTLNEKREIALGTVRSIARSHGHEPSAVSVEKALMMLDDEMRQHPDTVASVWYENATEHQIILFKQEWRRWCAAAQTEAFSILHEKGSHQFGTDWLVMSMIVKEAAEAYGMDARKERLVLSGIAYRACMTFAEKRNRETDQRRAFVDVHDGETFRLVPGSGQSYQKIPTKDTTELGVLHYGGADGRIVNAIPFPFMASELDYTDCLFISGTRVVFPEEGTDLDDLDR